MYVCIRGEPQKPALAPRIIDITVVTAKDQWRTCTESALFPGLYKEVNRRLI
jgi:hypothetical protein